ncbi:MAG: CRISPR/Cas system-associated exonuclease Cas4 (RecB family) [Cyclobacteriaceae bacterium]|jgi:CRISPR/Cas system-associated exonuclease Cas4 (RecB family)
MNTFLGELARELTNSHGTDLDQLKVIFPNRRAGVFFRKELSEQIEKPIWMPSVYSMEDFVLSVSSLDKIEKLEAIFILYTAYRQFQPEPEPFDRFFFWGEMILKDFEEIDQYLVDHHKLFTTISTQKELEEAFQYLDEEDKKVIEQFWNTFLPDVTDTQQAFLKTWRILPDIYDAFREALLEQGKGYGGLIYRALADRLKEDDLTISGSIVFAGFNALTAAEERIISWCVEHLSAKVYWDVDSYYLQDTRQEAGWFFRQYASHRVLGNTFPKTYPEHFSQPKEISATGVTLEIGQTKLLTGHLRELSARDDFKPERTVIVLPHEYMLPAVLHAIPEQIETLNVTMGFPLSNSSVFGLLDSMLRLQQSHRNSPTSGLSYYHKHLLDVIQHPLVQPIDPKIFQQLSTQVKKRNLIYCPEGEILSQKPLLLTVLKPVRNPIDFVLEVLDQLIVIWTDKEHDYELEFVYRFRENYTQLQTMLVMQNETLSFEFFIQLHKKVAQSLKVPFTGEPINGLQIMGILETRNLDFDHVFVLNMNEDSWPAAGGKGSFVPFNIRKAFDMPVSEHQDAIYSYLFYSLLQRSQTIHFYYNSISEFAMNGEPSRLLKQLEFESSHEIKYNLLSNPIQVTPTPPISIPKTERIFMILNKYVEGASLPSHIRHHSRLTPSALETYLHCRLKFYFRYVEELFEQDELQEDINPMIFGNILHDAMEILYRHHITTRKTRLVQETDFFGLEAAVDGAINQAFGLHYQFNKAKKIELEGRSVIASEIVRKLVLRILHIDKKHAPFEIVGLEADTQDGYSIEFPIHSANKEISIRLKGKIDRIDQKEGRFRIVDYKTGKDEKQFKNVESLTDRQEIKRNKAAFQVMFYSWLLKHSPLYKSGMPIEPGLYNSRDLFKQDFSWQIFEKEGRSNPKPVHDFLTYETDFEKQVSELLTDIWNPKVLFDQVEDVKKCEYCAYKRICGR